uniref:Uncharacterized protein n=1 Tax=Ananas comosus var. bracteatus TaxID=296719 RepID=A0A6V7QHN6_ANACO|nr:unnamed protein product [Ananas comosus var. bracteatus]
MFARAVLRSLRGRVGQTHSKSRDVGLPQALRRHKLDYLCLPLRVRPGIAERTYGGSGHATGRASAGPGRDTIPALDRATRRKMRLLEGDKTASGELVRKWTCKKVKAKGSYCGVNLSDSEASELRKLLPT